MRFYPAQLYDFNPRSHEGSDNSKINATHGIVISIHAPTRGATLLMPFPVVK